MSQLTTQLLKSPEVEKHATLPTKALGYISAVLAAASLTSCGVPYGYPQVGSYQNAPARNYNQGPVRANYQDYNNAPYQNTYSNAPQGNSYRYQGSGIDEQTRDMQEESRRLSAYNRAVNASANAIRAGIPSQFQNRNTRDITLMQARATTPRNLSADHYRSISAFKAAEANLRSQRLRSIGGY